jgi:hypothetical protein
MARAIRRHRSASALSSADVIIFVTSHCRERPISAEILPRESASCLLKTAHGRIARAVPFADGRAVEIPVF